MSVPGVGPVTSLQFVAIIDELSRFQSAHRVEAYLGLTPGEHSSSDKVRRTSITKAGSTAMRWCLVQAAWAARRARGQHAMIDWSIEVQKRRGKKVAIVALARKLAGILFAIWRDGTVYNPQNASRAVPSQTAA
jgi:transposase